MHERGIDPIEVRFDAIAVHLSPSGGVDLIEHVQDAFGTS
jgi:hypothetical protein